MLTRRELLLAGAAGLVAVACGGSDGGGASRAPAGPSDGPLAFYRAFRDQQPVGPPVRLPLALRNAETGDLDVALPATLDVVLRPPAGAPPRSPVTVELHREGVPRGYYPLTTTFDMPGTWVIESAADGTPLAIEIDARHPAELPAVPNPGDPLPRIPTPLVGDNRGVDPICTRQPACPFHDLSLDDAVASRRPIVLLVSTPAFCQTAICGPVLELVIDRQDDLVAAGAAVIHAEVYVDDRARQVAPVVDALGLLYEPSLFLAEPGGAVRSRLDYTFDRAELGTALDDLLGA